MTEIQKKALNAVFEKFDGMTDEELLKNIDSCGGFHTPTLAS